MKPADNINEFFRKAAVSTNPRMDEAVLDKVLTAHEKAQNTKPALAEPALRRTIMKSPITKLAAAAVIIALVVLGLFEFIDTENKSGVVWAQVAEKVDASRGLVVRCRETSSFLPNEDDYSIKYFSPTRSRTDTYKSGQITQAFYKDLETKTSTFVNHTYKHYMSRTFTPSQQGFLEKHGDWMNAKYLVETILSCEHRKLGQKTIEGVLCEGIETTDPACLGPLPGPVSRLDVEMRLWVDAKTKYPVLFEVKIHAEAEGKTMSSECVMDQFQWDMELDPSIFEPNIPPDFKDMRNL